MVLINFVLLIYGVKVSIMDSATSLGQPVFGSVLYPLSQGICDFSW